MELKRLKKLKLPDGPGVYFFHKGKDILYIGKATSLKDRVRSYFADDLIKTRGRLLVDMVTQAMTVKFQKTDSVLEAFLLESELIKKHQPRYNTDSKDDKSFNYVVLTKEEFPRLLVVRGRELQQAKMRDNEDFLGFEYTDMFGPYPYGAELKEALKLIRRLFPYRDKCSVGAGRPCFNATIGLCPGVCNGEMSKQDYAKRVNNLRLFFRGKKTKLVAGLKKQMKEYAKKMEFEQAHEIKRTLVALEHIQDISMIKKEVSMEFARAADADALAVEGAISKGIHFEAYDIAHLSGKNMVGVMVSMKAYKGSGTGEFCKNDYRKFNIKTLSGANDPAALKEIVSRRFNHPEWAYPDVIVIDGGQAQLNAVEEALKPYNFEGTLVSTVKDERHKAREVLYSTKYAALGSGVEAASFRDLCIKINAEAHRFALKFHVKKRGLGLK